MIDFTTVDKQNLLDLFVNNQKVLITIYEILFASANSMIDHQKISLADTASLRTT
jgi:hypothetical protein